MDGQARPNVAVQLGSECAQRCGCSAECCRRLMGGGGHIVSAPTKQEGASRASAHGADWVEARHRAQHRHSNSVQNTLGAWCGDGGEGSELNDCVGSPVSTSFVEWMPPPAERAGYRCARLVESKFISRLGELFFRPPATYTHMYMKVIN